MRLRVRGGRGFRERHLENPDHRHCTVLGRDHEARKYERAWRQAHWSSLKPLGAGVFVVGRDMVIGPRIDAPSDETIRAAIDEAI